jgi:Serine dehydrogenase proteinase
MPPSAWNRVLQEVIVLQQADQQQPAAPGQPSHQDRYRRSKIAAVESVTGRRLIIYASACTSPAKAVSIDMLMMDSSDKIGFKAVTENIPGPNLDVLIHSPGGYPDAVESLVQQLRGKYTSVRFIVPSYAKSAATMLAMSGNEILMDTDAELGPIDPQMRTQTGTSPAEAVLEQFQRAQQELQADATRLPGWMPILSQLGPSLLVDCAHAIDLAKALVKDWTKRYMLSGDPDAEAKSTKIADFLSSHGKFKSHGRPIKIPDLQPLGVRLSDIRTSPALHSAVDELYCCLDILLGNTPVYKLLENSSGDALIRQTAFLQAQFLQAMPALPAPPPAPLHVSLQAPTEDAPSRPLSAGAIRVVDSVLRARVPESAIRRD